jgi:hypothetical protein
MLGQQLSSTYDSVSVDAFKKKVVVEVAPQLLHYHTERIYIARIMIRLTQSILPNKVPD